VHIATTVEEWVAALEECLADRDREAWLRQVDERLALGSWDRTWAVMDRLIEEVENRDEAAMEAMEEAALRGELMAGAAGD
jgi:DNA-binding SARP family transcriptional activator